MTSLGKLTLRPGAKTGLQNATDAEPPRPPVLPDQVEQAGKFQAGSLAKLPPECIQHTLALLAPKEVAQAQRASKLFSGPLREGGHLQFWQDGLEKIFYHEATQAEDVEKLFQRAASNGALKRTRYLDFFGRSLGTSCGLKMVLRYAAHLTALETLDLSDCQIDAVGARALANVASLCALKHLNLLCNIKIGDVGVQAIADSPYLTNLQTLNLAGTGMGDESAVAFARAGGHFKKLQSLDLSGNLIGDAGAQAFARQEAAYLGELKTLVLMHNRIGKVGGQSLASAPHFKKELLLVGNPCYS